uniref:Uncharacterized protein n=1 Tax=Knipowitschia caucasica TaxID=637954 RepID=A0AAV2M602_KNICA
MLYNTEISPTTGVSNRYQKAKQEHTTLHPYTAQYPYKLTKQQWTTKNYSNPGKKIIVGNACWILREPTTPLRSARAGGGAAEGGGRSQQRRRPELSGGDCRSGTLKLAHPSLTFTKQGKEKGPLIMTVAL